MLSAISCRSPAPAASGPRSGAGQLFFKPFAPASAPGRAAAPARRQLHITAAETIDPQADSYPSWGPIFNQLTAARVGSISPVDANDLIVTGKAVLVDVRPKDDHEQAHPQGSVHIPAFQVITSPSSTGDWAKFLVCKANGVTPTKPNPQLPAQIAAAAADGKAVILACEAGGTLQPSVNFPQGKVSRSLKAAWKVVATKALPAEQVLHLEGGVYQWFSAGLPMAGEYDGSNAGRTP